MPKVLKITLLVVCAISFFSCGGRAQQGDVRADARIEQEALSASAGEGSTLDPVSAEGEAPKAFQVGAERMHLYVDRLKGRRLAIVANASSLIGTTHMVDTLHALFDLRTVFAPEHGFRGMADAGEKVDDEHDARTGLPIISLYGANKKPNSSALTDIDVLLFDLQDVGVRCYTYISTLHYVMEACAEQGVELIVLDRPNPNGRTADGPMLESAFKSFVGMHPVPLLHGMTIGEYAQMINGEGWLANEIQVELTVVPCADHDPHGAYALPVRPSPNLPNERSIALYGSLVLFEGTTVSVGRGTEMPFQVVGHPDYKGEGDFRFTPRPNEGAKYPKHEGQECLGYDLRTLTDDELAEQGLTLRYLLEMHAETKSAEPFFLENGFLHKLSGTDRLQAQIEEGLSEQEIRESWVEGLAGFLEMRSAYLLYGE